MYSVVSQEQSSHLMVAQGRELMQQGDKMAARRCLQRAVELEPGNADAWWLLGGLAMGRAQMEYWMVARRARFLARRGFLPDDEVTERPRIRVWALALGGMSLLALALLLALVTIV